MTTTMTKTTATDWLLLGLIKRAKGITKHYLGDITKHDRDAFATLSEGESALWLARECGSALLLLTGDYARHSVLLTYWIDPKHGGVSANAGLPVWKVTKLAKGRAEFTKLTADEASAMARGAV